MRKTPAMRRIGLTGGIGAGKSTAARTFAGCGATVVDADAIAREVVAPGTPGLALVAARFPSVIRDGAIDREALGRLVFADPERRQELEAITHPLVGAEVQRRSKEVAADGVLVYDVPLLVETGMAPGFDLIVVVEAPLALRLTRLEGRGLPPDQARERIAHQAGDADRRAVADVVLDNGDAPESLARAARALFLDRLQPFARNTAARTPAARDAVEVVPYDEDWPRQAGLLAVRLHRATGGEVEHVGSTAVPGLAAKDVIDLQLLVGDLAEADAMRERIEDAGFPARPDVLGDTPHGPGDWDKRFHQNADPGRAVNLHVRAAGSPGAIAATTFRDWLRATPDVATGYEAEKRRLAAGHPEIAAYADAKEAWFASRWAEMEAWGARR